HRSRDYAQVAVPDVRAAASFFRNVLDCEFIDTSASAKTSTLMACQSGTVLDLVLSEPGKSSVRTTPLRLTVSDVDTADQWLRKEGARVVGVPVKATSGPDAGQTVVNFVSPWGMRLQLVGSTGDRISALP
ncbi:MAG: VOC family protein, partial [Pseudomonadota bacterium]|nr:VOC family protein [Pseudomonadota bacterium]